MTTFAPPKKELQSGRHAPAPPGFVVAATPRSARLRTSFYTFDDEDGPFIPNGAKKSTKPKWDASDIGEIIDPITILTGASLLELLSRLANYLE